MEKLNEIVKLDFNQRSLLVDHSLKLDHILELSMDWINLISCQRWISEGGDKVLASLGLGFIVRHVDVSVHVQFHLQFFVI